MTTPTKSRKCRAKNPATCRVHRDANIPVLRSIPEASQPPQNPSSPLWDTAFEEQSDLTRPRWAQKAEFAHSEVISRISTPDGDFTVMWENQSQDSRDLPLLEKRGIRVARVVVYDDDGIPAARISASYMDQESIESVYGNDEFTIYRHRREMRGESTIPKSVMKTDLTDEEKLGVWRDIVTSKRRYSYDRTPRKPVEEMTQEELTKEANQGMRSWYVDDYKKFIRNFHHPFVDFSRVIKPDLLGKGYGTLAYLHIAKQLGKQGKVLRGSGLQSAEAQAVWQRLVKTYPSHIKIVKMHDDSEDTNYVLDFRSS